MTSYGELGRLTDAEYADLNARVDQFHAARVANPSTQLEPFLPPAGTRVRPFVIVELIKTDMEQRAKGGHPIRLESYLGRFQEELPSNNVPLSLIAEEFRLRHKYADKPTIEEYRHRFRDQFGSLVKLLATETPTKPPLAGTVGFETTPIEKAPSDENAHSTRVVSTPIPVISRAPTASGSVGLRDVLPAGLEYKLLRRIGKGAFGEVFAAEAPGGVTVAIKRILRSLDHPASQGEIESLEAIKALSHPFLLKTNAYWVFEDRLVIVMELADESLEDRIESHKKQGLPGIPPEELIPIFEQAAEALDYLHSQNVSHRDVKPQNLLLLRGYAKVADFGLARTQEHTLTAVGSEIGTPMYMAPEVWSHKVSLHSDQYSLAATYISARLGRPPFATRLIHELAEQHVKGTPDVSGSLAAEKRVLLKAMAKRPDDRYPSCAEFAKALRVAVLTPPETVTKRRWMPATIAAATALLCGLTAGIVNWSLRPDVVAPQPGPTQETLKPMWCPDGWAAVPEAGKASSGGKDHHKRLTRNVGGEDLVAILITPTRPGEPPPFYMLENKITNRVFKAEWERAEQNPTSAIRTYQDTDPDLRAQLLPGEWRNGAPDLKKPVRLGIAGARADAPVVAVTVPEAMLVAQELGGLLPTYNQWLKAVGAMDGIKPGPAGPTIVIPPELTGPEKDKERMEFQRRALRKRNLALGLEDGPMPVRTQTDDVSYFGINQLLSNGFEWTGEDDAVTGRRLSLFQRSATEHYAVLVGQTWEVGEVITLDSLSGRRQSQRWNKWQQYASFRVVLEPP